MSIRFLLPILVLAVHGPLRAQALPDQSLQDLRWHGPDALADQVPPPAVKNVPRDGVTLGFAGLVGAVGGTFVGGVLGARLEDCEPYDDYCGLAGAVVGASIGSTFSVPLGVHLANQSRGNYAGSFLGSALVAGVGWSLTYATEDAVPLLFIPVGQIVVSAIIERMTTK